MAFMQNYDERGFIMIKDQVEKRQDDTFVNKDQRYVWISEINFPARTGAYLRLSGIDTLQEFSSMLEIAQRSIVGIQQEDLEIIWKICDQYNLQRFDDSLTGLVTIYPAYFLYERN